VDRRKENPYFPTKTKSTCKLQRWSDARSGRLLWILFSLHVVIIGATVIAGQLQLQYDDEFMNPVADVATLMWLLSLAVGVIGAIVASRTRWWHIVRLAVIPVVWFMLFALYLGWVLLNFTAFMLPHAYS